MAMLVGTRRALFPKKARVFGFDLGLATFTESMDKRLAPGPFAAAPICQGHWDGTGTPDVVSFPRGTQFGNPTGVAYANFDPYQGVVVKWWTPEKSRDIAQTNDEYLWFVHGNYFLRYEHDGGRFRARIGGQDITAAHVSVAGVTTCVVVSWDAKKTIDGVNYARVSLNNVHTFGITSQPTLAAPLATPYLGSNNGVSNPANAILEGVVFYRRVLTANDGTGMDVGNTPGSDELTEIYNAGAGEDPCIVTNGSWDVPFCLPTDSTVGAFTTGALDAWSHPILSQLHEHSLMEDGGYWGGAWGVLGNGTNTTGNAGSAVALDDMPDGANGWTWDGWIRSEGADIQYICYKGVIGTNGWSIRLDSGGRIDARIENATTDSRSVTTTSVNDGKDHHIAVAFEHIDQGGDSIIYIAVDGVWEATYLVQDTGNGAFQADAVSNQLFGHGSSSLDGIWGWQRFSNTNGRYTVGTDFIAPRAFPAADGSTIEAWSMADGSGAAAVAQVTSPGNDAALTNHAWEAQWEPDSTPLYPQSLEFFQENDGIDFGSGVNIDDLPSGDCTIEFWARIPLGVATNTDLFSKTSTRAEGWSVYLPVGQNVGVLLNHATDALAFFGVINDDIWHHFAVDWEFATLTVRAFLDGVLIDTDTAVGAYVVDAAEDCLVNARGAIGVGDTSFAIGPIRLSNTRRYTGTYFVPPGRTNWPANDANAQLITRMQDGAGATVTDYSGNGYNGTVTFGATTKWNNTPDMSVDAPGKRFFEWGYAFGSDGANDGIQTIVTGLTPGDDYVVRAVIGYDPDGRAEPAIRLYDNIGAAQIVQLAGPRLEGAHTGANNSATLIDAGARWPQSLVGATVYNVTDGSTATVTAISGDGTTITGALGGGTDNDWDTNDVYLIVPPYGSNYAWVETFCFTLPAGCTSLEIQIRNLAAEGVAYVQQIEVLENLLINGDHESLTGGNPDLITGWTNGGLDPGDTQASSGGGGVIHSGAEAMQWNVGASAESMYRDAGQAANAFVSIEYWSYGDGAQRIDLAAAAIAQALLQYSTTARILTGNIGVYWDRAGGVYRCVGALQNIQLYASVGAGGARYTDDVAAILCDPITLTVTPANQANSLEGTGIRVDGGDDLSQPVPPGYLRATSGHIRFWYTPRHDAADQVAFGTTGAEAFLLHVRFDGTRYFAVYWSAANTVTLEFNDGAGVQAINWNATGLIVTDTRYKFDVWYTGAWMRLWVDDVLRAEIASAINFTAIPNIAYWLQQNDGTRQADAVIDGGS